MLDFSTFDRDELEVLRVSLDGQLSSGLDAAGVGSVDELVRRDSFYKVCNDLLVAVKAEQQQKPFAFNDD